jgi:tRNA pseudouridine55 synthase
MSMDAVINLDKPKGLTSQAAVTVVKRTLKAGKAGHAGSLDPIATGVLLVCLGEATKLSRFLMGLEKRYRCTLKFGERTDTYDAEGKVIEKVNDVMFGPDDITRAINEFKGRIMQTPPMYSAIKVKGSPLYRLARKGVEIERAAREVEIKTIAVESFEYPFLSFYVECSKGTYIRSLCDDIGRALGTVAHMVELRRTGIGRFSDRDSVSPEFLPSDSSVLLSPDYAVSHLKEVVMQQKDYDLARNGGVVKYPHNEEGSIRVERILHLSQKP